MSKATVYVIHGYMASSRSHWFPWLKKQIEAKGHVLRILSMPRPAHPTLPEWIQELHEQIPAPSENTFFVAHSLGCVALLQYLSELSNPIGGVICVSGFSEKLGNLPELDAFNEKKYDVEKIKRLSREKAVILSEDDDIVPAIYTEALANELGVLPIRIERGGHFLGSEGFLELPIVLEILQEWLPKTPHGR